MASILKLISNALLENLIQRIDAQDKKIAAQDQKIAAQGQTILELNILFNQRISPNVQNEVSLNFILNIPVFILTKYIFRKLFI